jgi:hypothetical protein
MIARRGHNLRTPRFYRAADGEANPSRHLPKERRRYCPSG